MLADRRRAWLAALAAVLIVVAVARIVATYPVFSHTFDEPIHVAAGMEWLDRGTFTYEVKHPPLGRVAVALGPYLTGLRSYGRSSIWKEGLEILYARGSYSHNLALARLGVLPFFILATLVVWVWARRLFGDVAALISAALFTTTPTVLAHAGLATTDMPFTATFLSALLAFVLWLDRPSVPRSVLLGAAGALALLSKMSAVLFLPVCALAIAVARWLICRRALPGTGSVRRAGVLLAAAGCVAFFVLWAAYRFSIGNRFGSYVDGGIPVPAPELILGFKALEEHNAAGHVGYLFGRHSEKGWWYYFPVALAVKTPIPFLLLAGVGIVAAIKLARARRDWYPIAPPLAAAAILAAVMPAHINIGVRHVLPIYPLLAIVAGYGTLWLWYRVSARIGARAIVVSLLVWQGVTSVGAHPDYLPYFNVLAGRYPERVLLDSNLDWGQDLPRLADTVRARRITTLNLAYFGNADEKRHGLPTDLHLLDPNERVTGWVAVSETHLKGLYGGGYTWLDAYEPVARVGKSIRLFYVPPL